jgi:hypothetical protein
MTHAATPTKLKNGNWGAKVTVGEHSVIENDTITITTRSGKSWTAFVGRVYWRGQGVVICETKSAVKSSRARHGGRRGGWCDCGGNEDPMSFFPQYAGQVIKCPNCGGKIDVS